MDDAVFHCARSSQNISIAQVMAFVTAADCGSFTKAAQLVRLSQPALSRCIKDLESALGVVLFSRSQKGVALSPQGQTFLPMAKRLLRSYGDARSSMAQWRAGAAPSLAVMGSVSVMPVVLPTLLRNLQAAYGRASMRVGEALSTEVVQHVLDGRATLGVCADVEHHSALRYTPVLEAQFGLLARPDHTLPPHVNSLRDLDHMPLVRCAEQALVTRALRRHAVEFPAYFESSVIVDNVQAATELVIASGMATVATGVGASHGKAAGLKFIPLPRLLPAARVDIVSRRDALYDERMERLRDILRDSIHGAPWHAGVRCLGVDTTSGSAGMHKRHAPTASASA